MKMSSGMFWGLLLIVIGISLIIKIVFNIDFPIFRLIVAFIFIYIGIKIIVGKSFHPFSRHKTDTEVVFGESSFDNIEPGKEYSVVFSKGVIDLRGVQAKREGGKVKISTVFGSSVVIVDKSFPVKINVDAVFSGAHLPNGNSTSFGTTIYESDSLDVNNPYLEIKADVVFGDLKIEER
ncbi:MAG TPA: hypothetical protein PK252_01710 [Bacteroidales bacterium]|nr:hypothetical protein [Bacteroidales bacterium]